MNYKYLEQLLETLIVSKEFLLVIWNYINALQKTEFGIKWLNKIWYVI